MSRIMKLGILLLFMVPAAHSLQEKVIDNPDSRVFANIAKSELNRIFIDADKIAEVKGDFSRFILEADENNGQIFIMPNAGETAPISLFLISELHNTVSILLTPKDIKAETIKLVVPRNVKSSTLLETKKTARANTGVIKLIKAMFARDISDPDIKIINRYKIWPKTAAALKVSQQQEYILGDFTGYLLKISNPDKKQSRTIDYFDFQYGSNIVAISMEQTSIPAKGSAYVYVVKCNRGRV